MSSPLRHLNALRAFEAAARRESFAKAAGELNVSHSVVSQHIRNLENWFGTSLFIRYGNRVELSDDGRALLPQVSNGFQILGDACESLLKMSRTGTVNIFAEPALASRWLRPKISEFNEKFPGIEINLKPAWDALALDKSQADVIAHFETRLPSTGVNITRLFPVDAFPAASPELIGLIGERNWESGDYPLIHDNGREIWRQWFTHYLSGSTGWEGGKVFSDFSLSIDAAVDGEGIILADHIICNRELQSGALKKLDDREIRCVWYGFAIADKPNPNLAAITFVEWIKQQS